MEVNYLKNDDNKKERKKDESEELRFGKLEFGFEIKLWWGFFDTGYKYRS